MSPVTVAVVVPVYNEMHNLPRLIASIERQTLKPNEAIVVDGRSTDGTREWLQQAQRDRPWLRVVDNPGRVIPLAMNAGIRAADSDLIARMDAHAHYPPEYLETLTSALAHRPEVVAVGARMRTEGSTTWGRAIAVAMSRPWGLGGAPHRIGARSGPVSHTFSPVYRRRALEEAGGFDLGLLANEDFELDFRLRQNGGTVWLESSVETTWFTRNSYASFLKQMFRYGFYKARTLWLHPSALQIRQVAPPAAVLIVMGGLLLPHRTLRAGASLYLATSLALGGSAARRDDASAARAALATPSMHLAWGLGLITGVLRHAGAKPRLPGWNK